MSRTKYAFELAKSNRSKCRFCEIFIRKYDIRIKASFPVLYLNGKDFHLFYHPRCLLDTFMNAKETTMLPHDVREFENSGILTDKRLRVLNRRLRDIKKSRRRSRDIQKSRPRSRDIQKSRRRSRKRR